MLGGIAALLIAVWFYKTAVATKDPKPWLWVFIGVVCFYGVFTGWSFIVARPILLMVSQQHHNYALTFLIWSSGILAAAGFAAFIRHRYLVQGRSG